MTTNCSIWALAALANSANAVPTSQAREVLFSVRIDIVLQEFFRVCVVEGLNGRVHLDISHIQTGFMPRLYSPMPSLINLDVGKTRYLKENLCGKSVS